MKNREHLFNSKEAKTLWENAVDAYRSGRLLSEIYDNVPEEIANVRIEVLEFHRIDCNFKLKRKVLKWLDGV